MPGRALRKRRRRWALEDDAGSAAQASLPASGRTSHREADSARSPSPLIAAPLHTHTLCHPTQWYQLCFAPASGRSSRMQAGTLVTCTPLQTLTFDYLFILFTSPFILCALRELSRQCLIGCPREPADAPPCPPRPLRLCPFPFAPALLLPIVANPLSFATPLLCTPRVSTACPLKSSPL